MEIVITGIKIAIISLLSIFYWPLNTFYLWLQDHYFKWRKEDRISYYVATPLYYLLFLLTAIISIPLESMGEAMHPPLKGFQ